MNPPHPIDLYIGRKVRHWRLARGMSQEALGEVIGITSQQIQKYECAQNRISSSRLWEIGGVLGIAPEYFFPDAGAQMAPEEHALPPELLRSMAILFAALPDELRPPLTRGLKEMAQRWPYFK